MHKRLNNPEALHRFIQTKVGTPNHRNQVIHAEQINKHIRSSLALAALQPSRHTHASRLIQNGLSVYEVRAVLGHTDIKTTMRYAHLEQVSVTQKARDVINRLNSL